MGYYEDEQSTFTAADEAGILTDYTDVMEALQSVESSILGGTLTDWAVEMGGGPIQSGSPHHCVTHEVLGNCYLRDAVDYLRANGGADPFPWFSVPADQAEWESHSWKTAFSRLHILEFKQAIGRIVGSGSLTTYTDLVYSSGNGGIPVESKNKDTQVGVFRNYNGYFISKRAASAYAEIERNLVGLGEFEEETPPSMTILLEPPNQVETLMETWTYNVLDLVGEVAPGDVAIEMEPLEESHKDSWVDQVYPLAGGNIAITGESSWIHLLVAGGYQGDLMTYEDLRGYTEPINVTHLPILGGTPGYSHSDVQEITDYQLVIPEGDTAQILDPGYAVSAARVNGIIAAFMGETETYFPMCTIDALLAIYVPMLNSHPGYPDDLYFINARKQFSLALSARDQVQFLLSATVDRRSTSRGLWRVWNQPKLESVTA